MKQLQVTDSVGEHHAVPFRDGDTLMEALRDAGFEEIEAICGGGCSCATCHVHVLASPVPLPEMEEDEAMLLELTDAYDENKSRLSCQINLQEEHVGMRVQLVSED